MRAALALLVLTACGGSQGPAITVQTRCEFNGMSIALEEGAGQPTADGFATPIINAPTPAEVCQKAGQQLQTGRSVYEARWGIVALEGWTIRIRTPAHWGDVKELANGLESGVSGTIYRAEKFVDVSQWSPRVFPHELHHLQLGPSSGDHHGWCAEFEPWEETALHMDERDYLGCNP